LKSWRLSGPLARFCLVIRRNSWLNANSGLFDLWTAAQSFKEKEVDRIKPLQVLHEPSRGTGCQNLPLALVFGQPG